MTSKNDSDSVLVEWPDLQVEGGPSANIVILQQGFHDGNVDRVAINRQQVRSLAEYLGLLPAAPPRRDAAKTLARRLRVLAERCERMEHMMQFSPHEQADLDSEHAYAIATNDVAREFVADLDELLDDTLEDDAPDPPPVAPPRSSPGTPATVCAPVRTANPGAGASDSGNLWPAGSEDAAAGQPMPEQPA